MGDDALQQFTAVTNAPEDAAKFFLESSNGDVAAAVDQYFATGGQVPADGHPAQDVATGVPPQEPALGIPVLGGSSSSGARPPPDYSQGPGGSAPGGGAAPAPRAGPRPAAPRPGNVRSLADLGGGNDGGDEDEDEDEDEGNEYYAGGEKSGQVVRGAPRDRVEGLFDRARQAGAQAGPAPPAPPVPGAAFSGAARTLAGGEVAAVPSPAQPPQPMVHTIAFYQNGVFTVDGGEARSMADSANRAFLEAVARGECPAELEPRDDAPVSVNLVRHAADYVPPPTPAYVAFQGTGRTLAGEAGPSTIAANGAAAPEPPAAASSVPWEGPDESKPVTSIQIRLHDGARLVARFNPTQRVADLRSFIRAMRPDLPPGYRLMTAFPPAQLTDDNVTLRDAGLENAVVIQKP